MHIITREMYNAICIRKKKNERRKRERKSSAYNNIMCDGIIYNMLYRVFFKHTQPGVCSSFDLFCIFNHAE